MAVSSVKGCVSVSQEGNSYSQNAELRWDNRSVKQGMKYQVPCSTLGGKMFDSLGVAADGWCLEENPLRGSVLLLEGSAGNAQSAGYCWPGQSVSSTLSVTHTPG